MNKRATFLTITFLIGLVVAGDAMYHLYRNRKLADNAVPVTATVMYLDSRISNTRGTILKHHRAYGSEDTCYETVLYETKEGERIVWQPRFATSMPDWLRTHDVSEVWTAPILYDADDPHYWEFDTTMAMFVNWFALLVGGMALMSLPFGPYDAVMRRLRETDEERETAVATVRKELSAPPKSGEARETPRAREDETEQHVEFEHEDRIYAPAFAQTATEIESDRDDGFEDAEDPFATMR